MRDAVPLLELRGGWVRLEGTEVLRGVDFRVEKGDFVVLLGPNASGKSTLVKTLLGLLPLTSGEVWLYGQALTGFEGWDAIGYVPQRVTAASGVPATVQEVVLSGRAGKVGLLSRFTSADREAARRALQLVDLVDVEGEPVSALSGGQQQRVLIARALAAEPEVLVMDEPVASVDLAHQESLASALSELNRSGTSILLVAHSLGALQPLVKRAVVLEGGRVVHDGAPSQAVVHAHVHPHHDEVKGVRDL